MRSIDVLPHAPRAHSTVGLADVVINMPHCLLSPGITQDGILPLALDGATVQGHEHRFFFFREVDFFRGHGFLRIVYTTTDTGSGRNVHHTPLCLLSVYTSCQDTAGELPYRRGENVSSGVRRPHPSDFASIILTADVY